MEIYISIDGVIRNTIQKFNYHYVEEFLNSEFENETDFKYEVVYPIQNNNISTSHTFQSKEEFEFFLFIEYPIEIFGHAGLSYSTTFSELNKLIHDNPEHNFTLIGLNEFGKAKPSTLFFLSKNGFLGNNIKFIKNKDLNDEWNKCDLWISDNKEILDLCPEDKIAIKFNTQYNEFFTFKKEINKLSEINEPCLKFLETSTTSTSITLPKNVE